MNAEYQVKAEGPVRWDPYDPKFVADPYPLFRRLREEAPLYYNEQYKFYALSRFEDVQKGLQDHTTFISGKGAILEIIQGGGQFPEGIFIFEDPPKHTVHRGILTKVFSPKALNALEPQVREFTVQCLDPLIGSDGFDVIEKLGGVMPMQVIGMMLGIPDEDLQKVRKMVDEMLATEGGGTMAEDSLAAMGEGFSHYIDWRENNPSDDLMTQLMNEEFEDENGIVRKLSREEILTFVQVVAGAGNETTNRLIGWSAKVLAEHPEQRQQLIEDPSLISLAIEEILRFEPPPPHIARYVTKDVEYYGQTVPAGSAMIFLVGSANRDDRQFKDGDLFDINRERRPHITFGSGIHTCMGRVLARIEGRVALEEMLKRFPTWKVDMEHARLSPTSTVRGWEVLPIYFGDNPTYVPPKSVEVESLPAPPVSAESLIGEWTVTIKGPTGSVPTTLVLELDGGQFVGTQTGEGSTTPISEARLDGATFSWVNEVTKPIKLKAQFTGEVVGKTMSGRMKAGAMGKFRFNAVRNDGTAVVQIEDDDDPSLVQRFLGWVVKVFSG